MEGKKKKKGKNGQRNIPARNTLGQALMRRPRDEFDRIGGHRCLRARYAAGFYDSFRNCNGGGGQRAVGGGKGGAMDAAANPANAAAETRCGFETDL